MNQDFLSPKIARYLVETYRATPNDQQFLDFLQELGRFYFDQTEVPKIIDSLQKLAAGEIQPPETAPNIPTNLRELVANYERWQELQEEQRKHPSDLLAGSRDVQRARFLVGLREHLQNKPKTEALEHWIEEKQTKKIGQVLTSLGIPQQDTPNIGHQIAASLREQTKTRAIEPQKVKEILATIIGQVRPGVSENQISKAATNIAESGLFDQPASGIPSIESLPGPLRRIEVSRASRPSPPSPPTGGPPTPQSPSHSSSILYLYYRPAIWTSLFLNNLSVLFGKESRTNKVVLEQALTQFLEKNQKFSQNLSFVEKLRQQIAIETLLKERIERAYFDSEQSPETEKSLRKQGFDLLRLSFNPTAQKIDLSTPSPPPTPSTVPSQVSSAVTKQTASILKNLVSKAAIVVRQLFTNPNLGWLRTMLSLSSVVGAIVFPIATPLKIVLGGFGGSLAVAQAGRSPGILSNFISNMGMRIAQGLARFAGQMALRAVAAWGTPLLIAIIVVVGGLLFLGWFNTNSSQGIFLKEGVIGLEENYESEFIGLEKTVNPTSSGTTPVTANFTITITAKKNKLTNIVVKDHFSVFSSKGNPAPPSVILPTIEDSLVVGQTINIPFSIDLGTEFQDSIVTNTVEVTAEVEDGPQGEKVTRSASIQIGETPTSCFVFNDSWPSGNRNLVMQAIGHMSQAPNFMGKLCAGGGGINVKRSFSSPGWSGEVINTNTIILYNNAFTSAQQMMYVMAHESGHVFAWRNTNTFREFLRVVNPPTYEGYIPTYPAHLGQSPSEDFAETIAIYAVWRVVPQLGAYPLNVIRDTYTRHFSFAKNNIFDGFEF